MVRKGLPSPQILLADAPEVGGDLRKAT